MAPVCYDCKLQPIMQMRERRGIDTGITRQRANACLPQKLHERSHWVAR